MEIFLDDRSCREVEEHSVKSSNMYTVDKFENFSVIQILREITWN